MWKGMFLFGLLLLLVACTPIDVNKSENQIIPYNYTFEGSGQYWKAVFITKGTETWMKNHDVVSYDHLNNEEMKLSYIGTDNKPLDGEGIQYEFDMISGGGSGVTQYDALVDNGIITHRSSSKGGAKTKEDDVVRVKVVWGDHEETFELINNEQ
jgi:hypothetical protein